MCRRQYCGLTREEHPSLIASPDGERRQGRMRFQGSPCQDTLRFSLFKHACCVFMETLRKDTAGNTRQTAFFRQLRIVRVAECSEFCALKVA